MSAVQVIALLLPLKAKQIENTGGYDAWNKLNEDEKAKADVEIIWEVGRQALAALSEKDQQRLTLFIRTGCCMHKDLNTVKGVTKQCRNFGWLRIRLLLSSLKTRTMQQSLMHPRTHWNQQQPKNKLQRSPREVQAMQ